MASLEIDIKSPAGASWDIPQPISLGSDDICFTELVRDGSNKPDDYLQAPPIQLAFWLTDNWWRMRWEPVVSGLVKPEWCLAHELSAIGGGYIWPRLRIWGEDTWVGLASRSDPLSMNFAVRYTKDALVFVSAAHFETAVDQFLEQAVEAPSGDKVALQTQLAALKSERDDQDVARWRRVEAQLGYDADEAPNGLVETLLEYMQKYGRSGVEEAIVAIQGEMSIETLKGEIAIAKQSRLTCELQEAVVAAGGVNSKPEGRIWECAEDAARRVRRALGDHKGPLRNTRLAELLGISREDFRAKVTATTDLSYGLRLREGDATRNIVALRARWSHDRRFELCRTLGDAIWSDSDALGPMTSTKTGRQKFQRAFAQSLLCPYDDLLAYMNTEDPIEDDISAAARHFHVSERVIQTTLVNKHRIDRQRFDEMVEAA